MTFVVREWTRLVYNATIVVLQPGETISDEQAEAYGLLDPPAEPEVESEEPEAEEEAEEQDPDAEPEPEDEDEPEAVVFPVKPARSGARPRPASGEPPSRRGRRRG